MITVTETAQKELEKYFREKETQPLRIYRAYGWGGPRLRLTLDESTENDRIYRVNGFTFMIDPELEGMTGDITIDKTLWGLYISSELKPGGMSDSCSR